MGENHTATVHVATAHPWSPTLAGPSGLPITLHWPHPKNCQQPSQSLNTSFLADGFTGPKVIRHWSARPRCWYCCDTQARPWRSHKWPHRTLTSDKTSFRCDGSRRHPVSCLTTNYELRSKHKMTTCPPLLANMSSGYSFMSYSCSLALVCIPRAHVLGSYPVKELPPLPNITQSRERHKVSKLSPRESNTSPNPTVNYF